MPPCRLLRALGGAAVFFLFSATILLAADKPESRPGYYRYPAIHGDTIVFTSEGDLWSVKEGRRGV
jgi:tricorn protease